MENKDRCYSYSEINQDLLRKFSEGSKALEDLLIYCYENKIETRACCIGHREDGYQSKPYISFVIPEEQQFIIETVINYLLSQNSFSEHVQVEIQKGLVVLRFDYLDIELRDAFFSLIHKVISNIIENGIVEPGIYQGLIDAYSQVSSDDSIQFEVISKGINIYESKDIYFKLVGDDVVEVPMEEAEFFNSVLSIKEFITTNKIASFIAANRVESIKPSISI